MVKDLLGKEVSVGDTVAGIFWGTKNDDLTSGRVTGFTDSGNPRVLYNNQYGDCRTWAYPHNIVVVS